MTFMLGTGDPGARDTSKGDAAGPGATRRPLCFIVDDEPAISRFIGIALDHRDIDSAQFSSAQAMVEGLSRGIPALIFLDVSLGNSDAIEAIRGLAGKGFRGAVQLMSGRDAALLEEVRRVGER